MAAFLTEMKSVRLRKVGGGETCSGSVVREEGSLAARGSSLARSLSAGNRPGLAADRSSSMADANSSMVRHGLPSFSSLGSRTEDNNIGGKRKRDGGSQDDIRMCLGCSNGFNFD